MQNILLKAKLHRAQVTHAMLDYEGSLSIDSNLLELAGMHENEQIQVYNINNGERFTTYIISGEPGSGIISVNGAAAHKVTEGDIIIVCAYGIYDENEIKDHKPRLIYMGEGNSVSHTANAIPVQLA
ncbi:aspartate 1-decarboxylase [Candidatus Sororendozoicomonas aggregata]|uniref:aspartate 1-decarboxylase n=1 Tax=Candidatus Sororendozoicomonas aggregata TaxID=3073239 RepID=UPI002ED3528D